MIAITTNSSIKVKALRERGLWVHMERSILTEGMEVRTGSERNVALGDSLDVTIVHRQEQYDSVIGEEVVEAKADRVLVSDTGAR